MHVCSAQGRDRDVPPAPVGVGTGSLQLPFLPHPPACGGTEGDDGVGGTLLRVLNGVKDTTGVEQGPEPGEGPATL